MRPCQRFSCVLRTTSGRAQFRRYRCANDGNDRICGFLVAIIAVLGDPGALPKGSWRRVELRRPKLVSSVIRHASLFYVYLVAIALLFIGVLVSKEPCSVVPLWVKIWVERAYLFFGVFSFLLTLGLPKSLADIQIARTDAENEERRRAAGMRSEDNQ